MIIPVNFDVPLINAPSPTDFPEISIGSMGYKLFTYFHIHDINTGRRETCVLGDESIFTLSASGIHPAKVLHASL